MRITQKGPCLGSCFALWSCSGFPLCPRCVSGVTGVGIGAFLTEGLCHPLQPELFTLTSLFYTLGFSIRCCVKLTSASKAWNVIAGPLGAGSWVCWTLISAHPVTVLGMLQVALWPSWGVTLEGQVHRHSAAQQRPFQRHHALLRLRVLSTCS